MRPRVGGLLRQSTGAPASSLAASRGNSGLALRHGHFGCPRRIDRPDRSDWSNFLTKSPLAGLVRPHYDMEHW